MPARVLTALVAFVALLSVGVAQADAGLVEWADHRAINSGENIFGPKVNLDFDESVPAGSGIVCAGIRGYVEDCPGSSYEAAAVETSKSVYSEPYAHDHSTFTTYFWGYWEN